MVFSRYSVVLLRSCVRNLTTNLNNAKCANINSDLSSEKSLTTTTTKCCRRNYLTDNKKKDINNNYRYYSTVENENQGRNKIENESTNVVLFSGVKTYDNDSENLDLWAEIINEKRPSALDKCTEDLSHIGPSFPVTFNFAAYANKSPTIQKLAELGVDFSKIEKRNGIAELLMPLDFEKDMKLHIRFLNDCGVPPDKLGEFLTKNPLIFREDLDDLHTRIRYLRAHKFTPDMITRLVSQNPFWIMFSTKRIDARLGFFQNEFALKGNEVRALATRQPRLITYKIEHVKENTFAVREEMGFDKFETKLILLNQPRIWMKNRQNLVECFDYLHNEMKLSHSIISQQPAILTCRLHRLKQRHMFLVSQGRAQYNPEKPLYVSLKSLVSNTDGEFCSNIAKTPVETFNAFLKTL